MHPKFRITRRRPILIIGLVILAILILIYYQPWSGLISISFEKCVVPDSQKNGVVSDLHRVLQQLEQLPSDTRSIQRRILRVIRLMDPKYLPITDIELHHHQQQQQPIYTCPEIFIHAAVGHPYFITGGWIPGSCDGILTIRNALSITLFPSTSELCSQKFSKLLYSIRDLEAYITIFVAVSYSSAECFGPIAKKLKIRQVTYDESSTERSGYVWNDMISRVQTPYVLIGRNLDTINWLTRLDRQISIFESNPSVSVVGGSVRNLTGHWDIGCYQTRHINYVLEYKDGYLVSKNECMFCDHLTGPFIARTSKFVDFALSDQLPPEVLFEDFFLRLHKASQVIVNCPDAMYFATDSSTETKLDDHRVWLPLVSKWNLNRIALVDGTLHKFTCQQSNLKCKELYTQAGYLMMPICCMDQIAYGLRMFHQLCKENGIVYQLEAGSVLGAVKLRDVIPWDFDGDGSYYSSNISFFSEWRNLSGGRDGEEVYIDHQNQKKPGFFKISTRGFFTEMFPSDELANDLAGVGNLFRETPTLMRIRGVWVYGPPSPGLYARNMYGIEMLKHSNSWHNLGKKWWYDPYNVSFFFLPCEIPQHHACLDQFETDGNLQFDFP